MTWLEVVRQTLYVVGGIGAITFPVYYHVTTRGRWRFKEMGRFLMIGGLGWMCLYISGILFILFPDQIVREVIRLLLIISAGTFAWYQVWLYRKVRRQELARKGKEGTDATQ